MQGYRQSNSYYEQQQAQDCPPTYYGGGGAPQQQLYKSSSSSSSMQSSAQSMNMSGGVGLGYPQQQMVKKTSSFSSSTQVLTAFGTQPFCDITPSSFPPGTDPKVIECYNRIDRDGNGVIDDRELQSVLSSCGQPFSMRTVHLLMYQFTHSNQRKIGPKEFVPLLNCLQSWRATFQRFDRDRNGSIDSMELGQALSQLGLCVSPVIVEMLIAKFNKSHVGRCSLQYDNFIEACLTVKGLTETFRAKADQCGKATFCYEEFLCSVMAFITA